MAEGFLGRWSQRKLADRQGKPPDGPLPEAQAGAARPVAPVQAAIAPTAATTAPVLATAAPARATPAPAPTVPVLPAGAAGVDTAVAQRTDAAAPTMQDVAALHKDSDFKPFVARAVHPEVRNAAMKKMFSDPHFNRMDGLDTYIDDYSLADPLPEAMLRKMASAQFLQLFDDDTHGTQGDNTQRADALVDGAHGADLPREDADGAAPPVVAQSPAVTDHDSCAMPNPITGHTGPHDDDTDLRLQPDNAPGPARPGRGSE